MHAPDACDRCGLVIMRVVFSDKAHAAHPPRIVVVYAIWLPEARREPDNIRSR